MSEAENHLYKSGNGKREFWNFINKNNYKFGVEIGVRSGDHCKELLSLSTIEILYGVDILKEVQIDKILEKYDNRFNFLHMSSKNASEQFDEDTLHFIYVDAWHSYESTKEDLELWWPKLKIGGLFCGDDYMDFDCPGECRFGVIQAVEEFAEKYKQEVNVIGIEGYTKEERIAFGNNQGHELNKKIANQSHNFLFNPQWYIYKT
jgi:hypothetical protein